MIVLFFSTKWILLKFEWTDIRIFTVVIEKRHPENLLLCISNCKKKKRKGNIFLSFKLTNWWEVRNSRHVNKNRTWRLNWFLQVFLSVFWECGPNSDQPSGRDSKGDGSHSPSVLLRIWLCLYDSTAAGDIPQVNKKHQNNCEPAFLNCLKKCCVFCEDLIMEKIVLCKTVVNLQE